jgi:transmembrane sensor
LKSAWGGQFAALQNSLAVAEEGGRTRLGRKQKDLQNAMRRETSQEIDDTAAEWAARVDKGPLSPQDNERLEEWLAGDSRRLGAFMRLRAVSMYSERAQALGTAFDPEKFGTPPDGAAIAFQRPTRRKFLLMTGSAVAASTAGILAFSLMPRGTVYESELGQVRVVSLDDGSVISLNTNSRVRVNYTSERRLISLEDGEALFDVAKDAARPFIVTAAGTSVRAVGTSFIVRKLAAAPVEVLVREGVVEVKRASTAAAVRMAANTRLVSSSSAAPAKPVAMSPEEIKREIAWKSGRIAFEGDTLESAAATFARYSDTKIVIDDPSVGQEQITGLFDSSDPVGFARAAALSLNLKASVGPGEVRLSRS